MPLPHFPSHRRLAVLLLLPLLTWRPANVSVGAADPAPRDDDNQLALRTRCRTL